MRRGRPLLGPATAVAVALAGGQANARTGPPPPPPPESSGTTAPAPTPATPETSTPDTSTTRRAPPPPPGAADQAGGETNAGTAEPERPPVDLSDAWGYSRRSRAPQPRYRPQTEARGAYAPNPTGFYAGVSVEGNQQPPHPPKKFGTKPASMTWTGFERTASGSRVFFQLSAEVDHTVQQQGGRIVVRMRNTRANVRNNMRRLDLRFFDTPVQTVQLRRRGRDLVATLVLGRQAAPKVDIVEGNTGYKLLVVAFEHGGGANVNADPPPPPPPPRARPGK